MNFQKKFLVLMVSLIPSLCWSQNLTQERIWKLVAKKKSIYQSKGVFHLNKGPSSTLVALRSSTAQAEYERLVLDFKTAEPPKLYGSLSEEGKKLSLDFFATSVPSEMSSLKNSKYIQKVHFYRLDPGQVTMELIFKNKVSVEVFYLLDPGRVVVDIRP